MDVFYTNLLEKLNRKTGQINSIEEFLFCAVNTAKAMIENTDKDRIQELEVFLTCSTSQEIKLQFDFFQGMFGQKSFSKRKSPNYLYLCSLIATFSEKELTDSDKLFLEKSISYQKYLLYDIG